MSYDFNDNFKVGQIIKHYCFGDIVEGKVTEVTTNSMTTEHRPVQWGNDIHTTTIFYWNQSQYESGFSGIVPGITKQNL